MLTFCPQSLPQFPLSLTGQRPMRTMRASLKMTKQNTMTIRSKSNWPQAWVSILLATVPISLPLPPRIFLANARIQAMHDALHEPDVGPHREYIEKAFGQVDETQLARIKENVGRMKDGKIKMKHAIPDGEYNASSSPQSADNGEEVLDASGRVAYKHVKLGKTFFRDKGIDDQALTLIHESAHVLAGAEDDVYGPRGTRGMKVADPINDKVRGIQIKSPGAFPNGRVNWKEAGCK